MPSVQPNWVWPARYCAKRLIEPSCGIPLWRVEQRLLGSSLYERIRFYESQNYALNFSAPRSFNEKIARRKLHAMPPDATALADKWAVRAFVAQRGHADILTPVLYRGTDMRASDFAGLPNRFAIKATHGSGWNILVNDKDRLDVQLALAQIGKWLKSVYGEATNEVHYHDIPPQIIIEQFIGESNGVAPIDYKFFVFHGKLEFIQVDLDRYSAHRRRFYDRLWRPQDFQLAHPLAPVMPRPPALERMIDVAEDLASGRDFVRVDLYALSDGAIGFGELTFAPGAGWERFGPTRAADDMLGALW